MLSCGTCGHAMAEIYVDSAEALALFHRVEQKAKVPKPAMRQIGADLERKVRHSFFAEVDPWGHAWPHLSSATIDWRRSKGDFTVKSLIESGALFESIEAHLVGNDVYLEVGRGLPDPRAAVQNFGNPANLMYGHPAPIPARVFLPINQDDTPDAPSDWITDMEDIYTRYLTT